jgi:pimeloyl-ACP methyl ester carboxylesterase
MNSMDVQLTTADGLTIAGTYTPGSLPFGVVLVHMMPADRRSYRELSEALAGAGFHALAIDLRGHGDSSGGDYRSFKDEQHQKSIFDVLAAVEYLKKQNPEMQVGFVGASIGASLALQYAAANPAAFLVLLSPGLNYRGIEAGRMAIALPEDLPTCFVSTTDDNRVDGNAAQAETLYNACSSAKKTIKIFRGDGHGTEILEDHPEFRQDLLVWVKEACGINATS